MIFSDLWLTQLTLMVATNVEAIFVKNASQFVSVGYKGL